MFLLIIIINIPLFLFSDENPFNINKFNEHIEFFSSKNPVEPRSIEESDVFDYIRNNLYEERIPYTSPLLYDIDDNPERITIIDVHIPGENETEIIFVAPVNGIKDVVGKERGGVNCGLALSLASYYQTHPSLYSVRILFLGSEFIGGDSSDKGSRHYMNNIYYTRDSVVIYLGLSDLSGKVRVIPGSNYKITPEWMMKELDKGFSSTGINYICEPFDQIILKSGLSGDLSPLGSYMENELPSVHLTNVFDSTKESLSGTINPKLLLLTLSLFLSEGDGTIPSGGETNYILFKMPTGIFILPELAFIISFLVFLLVLFVFVFFNKKVFVHHMRRSILPGWWWIPLSYTLTFIYLFLSSLVLDLIVISRGDSLIWTSVPLLFLLLKILATFLFSHIFLYVTGGLPLSRSPHFYSYQAILSTVLNILVFSAFNIRFANLFFWTLLVILIFANTKTYLLKIVSALIMPVALTAATVYLIQKPYPEFTRFILFSGVSGSLILTLVLQPFIAVFMAIVYMPIHYKKRISPKVDLIQPVILFLIIATLFFVLIFVPF